MKYRALDASGDYQLGRAGIHHVDSPEGVRQAIETRLKLMEGEWFLDLTEGTPYDSAILGVRTDNTRDLAVKMRILDTPGVLDILSYYSDVSADRVFTVSVTVATVYGSVSLTQQA